MASNAKSRARSEANKTRSDDKITKILADIRKIVSSREERVCHYVGGGQAYTTLKNRPGAAKIK